ncbi:SEC-C motif-containing protein [Caloramator quimbayensis]|uniref:SEC-C motif-containing protein n=1 Tax=Caloramator quimbayensis TaxID=1147123 RepID=A0A1T4Y4E1_9CLOT|nr:SEC-C metal-binding domain-containing protein [Caloramator quimbayensis]SKA96694.1 SEC-C motif-containing protein [Caloramator quimbayensis]
MSLFEKWEEIASMPRTQEEYDKFWEEYLKKEMDIYDDILKNKENVIETTVKGFGEKYNLSSEEVLGFLQGINTSLNEMLELESLEEDSNIKLDINFEKLFYNMIDAKASWLYELKSWDNILTSEKRKEIRKQYNIDHTVVKENKIGRNDPCPCGSGKKYKKCCGKNE